MLTMPIVSRLERAQNILICGAGGGFDVFAGLPLYFSLSQAGKEVHLANLSFTSLDDTTCERLSPALVTVQAHDEGPDYFPELHLCRWLLSQGIETEIYCFDRLGVSPVTDAYDELASHLGVDTILLADGGTDSLLRGDESGLGTPEEDAVSLIAADQAPVREKILVNLGWGVDGHHGVSHYDWFAQVAELTARDAFLGSWSLISSMPEVQAYMQAVDYASSHMPEHESVVHHSIISAIEGQFGDYHATTRTHGSELWINPLMPIYWFFDLATVAKRLLYRPQIEDTGSAAEVSLAIKRYREQVRVRPHQAIPG